MRWHEINEAVNRNFVYHGTTSESDRKKQLTAERAVLYKYRTMITMTNIARRADRRDITRR